jgi:hypothetical protein
VVGVEGDELLRLDVARGRPEAPAAEGGVDAVVDVRAVERLRELADAAELGVVALAVSGQQRA